jgi:hypothetical protein
MIKPLDASERDRIEGMEGALNVTACFEFCPGYDA